MKTKYFTCLITAAFLLAALPITGRAEKDKTTEASTAPTKETTDVTPATAPAAADATSAQWSSLKDLTYDQRVLFFDRVTKLEEMVDSQTASLASKRATMDAQSTDTKDWDFAMKEMHNSRSYLRGMIEELSKATRENWGQGKDKVGLAWVRTQDAYGKVKASTTQ